MILSGEYDMPNVAKVKVEMYLEDPTMDHEGPGLGFKLGNGQELEFRSTDVCCPDEYPNARQNNRVITFDGSEYIGDVIRRFIEYKASKS